LRRSSMGWKLGKGMTLEQYMLYTFGRLTSILCPREFKRRVKRALADHVMSRSPYGRHYPLRGRVYADFLFLIAVLFGMWGIAVLITVIFYTLLHDWKRCGGYRWIPYTWKEKFYGAVKCPDGMPLSELRKRLGRR